MAISAVITCVKKGWMDQSAVRKGHIADYALGIVAIVLGILIAMHVIPLPAGVGSLVGGILIGAGAFNIFSAGYTIVYKVRSLCESKIQLLLDKEVPGTGGEDDS